MNVTMIQPSHIESHKATVHRVSHYTDEQIRHLKESATKQERIIARWFWANPDAHIGPGALHDDQGYKWPITSTRRAITNLTEDGILVKTSFQSMGQYGRPEHHWMWNNIRRNNQQTKLFD